MFIIIIIIIKYFMWQFFKIFIEFIATLSSVQVSRSVVSDSLRLHEPQHARPPCPSTTPGVYPNLGSPKHICIY